MFPPSVYAHIANGILMLAAALVVYINFSVLKRLEPYKLLMILLVFSIGVGIHSLSHLGLEAVYGLNPFIKGYLLSSYRSTPAASGCN